MSAAIAAIVLFLFFAAGVAVGIVVVIALSARRAHKMDRAAPPEISRVGWPYLGEPDQDNDDGNDPPLRQARGDD